MKLLTLLFPVLLLASCATTTPTAPRAAKGTVDHVVLVWLKRPGNKEDIAALRTAAEKLHGIPGLLSVESGVVLPSERPVVDDSFDVGYTMRFDSVKSLRAYDPHPQHREQADKVIIPLSRKVVVYDYVR